MIRLALAATLLLAPLAVRAQSRGCIERPVGPPIDGAALGAMRAMVPPAGAAPAIAMPRGRGVVALPQLPSLGTECIAVMPPVGDVLRGEPAPSGGLLRGDDGRADLLRGPAGRAAR